MASAGTLLREFRQKHAASLDDLARTTKVAARQLEALEADNYAVLPAPPFVKGFIRAYCDALGEPADEALALYRAATATPGPESRPRTLPAPRTSRSRWAVLVSLSLLVVLGVALFALSLALRAGRDVKPDRQAAPPRPPVAAEPQAPGTAPAGATSLAPRSVPAPAGASVPPSTAPPAVAPPAVAGAAPSPPRPAEVFRPVSAPYRLVARVSAPTWVRVRMGGGRVVEETIPSGETREWVSNDPFVLTIGNAGGLALELNGQALPPLGKSGAVISRLVVPPEVP